MEMRLETGLSPAEDGVDVPGLSWNGVLGHGQGMGGFRRSWAGIITLIEALRTLTLSAIFFTFHKLTS